MLNLPLLLTRGAPFDQAFDGLAYTLYAFFDVFFDGEGVAQAKVLLTASIDVGWLSDQESNLLGGGFTQQGAGAHIAGQAAPQVKTAVGSIDTHLGWPVPADCLQHQIAFIPILLAQRCQVFIQQAAAYDF